VPSSRMCIPWDGNKIKVDRGVVERREAVFVDLLFELGGEGHERVGFEGRCPDLVEVGLEGLDGARGGVPGLGGAAELLFTGVVAVVLPRKERVLGKVDVRVAEADETGAVLGSYKEEPFSVPFQESGELGDIFGEVLHLRFVPFLFAGGVVVDFPLFVDLGSFPLFVKVGSFPLFVKAGSFPLFVKAGSFPLFVKVGSFPLFVKVGSFLLFLGGERMGEQKAVKLFHISRKNGYVVNIIFSGETASFFCKGTASSLRRGSASSFHRRIVWSLRRGFASSSCAWTFSWVATSSFRRRTDWSLRRGSAQPFIGIAASSFRGATPSSCARSFSGVAASSFRGATSSPCARSFSGVAASSFRWATSSPCAMSFSGVAASSKPTKVARLRCLFRLPVELHVVVADDARRGIFVKARKVRPARRVQDEAFVPFPFVEATRLSVDPVDPLVAGALCKVPPNPRLREPGLRKPETGCEGVRTHVLRQKPRLEHVGEFVGEVRFERL
jgi:hypothetical protein